MRYVTFLLALVALSAPAAAADNWRTDPIWYDGLVEKATYSATRVIYGKPRAHTAIHFTNKEQHDRKTLTKASTATDLVEVFKHNHIETVPTPNYPYHFVATTHLTTDTLRLTRLDVTSQEFCGTSFKQIVAQNDGWIFREYSYMPETGTTERTLANRAEPFVPVDSLPMWLRNYDFAARQPVRFWTVPTQKSNRPTATEPIAAEVRYAGEEDGSHKLEVVLTIDGQPQPLGTFWMATDRLHVMTRYEGTDGTTYKLEKLERVNYWTIVGE